MLALTCPVTVASLSGSQQTQLLESRVLLHKHTTEHSNRYPPHDTGVAAPQEGSGVVCCTRSGAARAAGVECGTRSGATRAAGVEGGTRSAVARAAAVECGTLSGAARAAGVECGTLSGAARAAGVECDTCSGVARAAGVECGTLSGAARLLASGAAPFQVLGTGRCDRQSLSAASTWSFLHVTTHPCFESPPCCVNTDSL